MEPDELGTQLVRLLPRLRRFASKLARSRQDADDLLQAAVLRVLTRADQIGPGGQLDRWMFRVLKTVWLNTRRAERVRRCEPLEGYEDRVGVDGGRDIEAAAEWLQVSAALARLPAGQRLPITLICLEGYTYQEASDLLHLPIGTLTTRIARGRRRLLRSLAPRSPHHVGMNGTVAAVSH